MSMSCLRLTVLAVGILCLAACQGESTHLDPITVTSRLVHLLEDSDPDVRRTAALSLGKIGHPAGLPNLRGALKDPDAQVREYSLWAISQIGESVDLLTTIGVVATLADPETAVQQASAETLGFLPLQDSIIDVLGEALSVGRVSSRQATVSALMNLASPRSYPALVEILQDPDPRCQARRSRRPWRIG